MTCNECNLLSINGVPCHEHGCPNAHSRWDGSDWIAQCECAICGYEYDADDICCHEGDEVNEFEEAQPEEAEPRERRQVVGVLGFDGHDVYE